MFSSQIKSIVFLQRMRREKSIIILMYINTFVYGF